MAADALRAPSPLPVFTSLATDRLLLRRLTAADAPAVHAYRTHPDVARYQAWEIASLADIEAFIEACAKRGVPLPEEWFQLGIALLDGTLIGDCGLRISGDAAQAEFGITLAPAFQGRGYAAEAVQALLAYAFEVLGLHRVTASVDPRNTPSMRLMARCGLRQEAYFVESYPFKGTWADDAVFALLARTWRVRHRAASDASKPADRLREPAMSENKETIARYLQGLRQGNAAEVLACLTEDVAWEMPGRFRGGGREAFERAINDESYMGQPTIEVVRLVEERDIVVTEGLLWRQTREGGTSHTAFCDVFTMLGARIHHLTSYRMELS